MTPTQTPTITLIFRGLFLFAFEKDNKFCQAGVIRADRHCLKIKITSKADSLQNSPELSFEIPDEDVSLEVSGRANGVATYQPGLFNINDSPDKRDFRWLLDLEGAALHNRQLPVIAGALKRSVLIRNGLFYTYSAHTVRIADPALQTRTTSVAQEIGCDIYLDDKEEAVLKYGPGGAYSITLKKEPDVSYEILVENICPPEGAAPAGGSDFNFYYDVVNVPQGQRFIVDAFPPPPANERHPCDPSCLGITEAPLS